jgi:large subunit ribosomal protein MRP49
MWKKVILTQCSKFWREMLPRIKFRNPAISITIDRHTDPNGPSLLHIYTKTPLSTPTALDPTAHTPPSAAQTPLVPSTSTSTSAPTHTLDMRDQQESEILAALVKTTGATEIQPTAQEEAEMAEMEEARERSERDRVLMRETLVKARREEELLKIARGEVGVVN